MSEIEATTFLPDFLRRTISSYSSCTAPTLPPGELIRRTTALTSSRSESDFNLFIRVSVGCRPRFELEMTPLIEMTATTGCLARPSHGRSPLRRIWVSPTATAPAYKRQSSRAQPRGGLRGKAVSAVSMGSSVDFVESLRGGVFAEHSLGPGDSSVVPPGSHLLFLRFEFLQESQGLFPDGPVVETGFRRDLGQPGSLLAFRHQFGERPVGLLRDQDESEKFGPAET